MKPDRIYRHFCMAARALELVGERWSLLVVRDLLLGPRRFTDLARSLGGITPTRLTRRLRRLEEAGIVTRDASVAGREVWYALTESGRELGPVVDALMLWGIEHALEPPRPDEPVYPDSAMIGTKVWLSRNADPPAEPVAWVWRFSADDYYTLVFDGGAWALTRGRADTADVTVDATPEAWARFLTTPRRARRLPLDDVHLAATRRSAEAFAAAFAADLR
jgi:DNA-binding HxlR family transcriptional regulator